MQCALCKKEVPEGTRTELITEPLFLAQVHVCPDCVIDKTNSTEAKPDPEEGGRCPMCNEGVLFIPASENCSCHVCAPCHECSSKNLTCSKCGWFEEPVTSKTPSPESVKADELQQQLEALKVPAAEPEDIGNQCLEHPQGVRCTKPGTFSLRWDGSNHDPVYYCDEHIAPFRFEGSSAIINPVAPPAEASVQKCFICGSTEIHSHVDGAGPLCVKCNSTGGFPEQKPAEAPAVKDPPPGLYQQSVGAVEEVPVEQECMRVFYGNAADPHAATGSCNKRAVAFLARNPDMKWCEEHLPEEQENRKNETFTRIVDWVNGKPMGEPDPSPEAVVHQAEPVLKEVSFKPAESGTEGLRVAIRELCQQRFGELTFVETIGTLEMVKMDLAEMLKQS